MIDVMLNNVPGKSLSGGREKTGDGSDKPIKSLMKSISWRIVGTIDTMVISYFITVKITIAIS